MTTFAMSYSSFPLCFPFTRVRGPSPADHPLARDTVGPRRAGATGVWTLGRALTLTLREGKPQPGPQHRGKRGMREGEGRGEMREGGGREG